MSGCAQNQNVTARKIAIFTATRHRPGKATVKMRAKPIRGGLSAPIPLFSAYFGPFPANNSQNPANLNKGPHRTAHKLPKLRGLATINALAQTTAYRTARRPVGPNVGFEDMTSTDSFDTVSQP